jgi:hypothetical protein
VSVSYFVENPEPFYTLAKELYPGSYKVCCLTTSA